MEPELFWYQNLSGGMDQATDFQLVENNASQLLKNIVQDKPGVWSARKGTTKLGSTTAGSDRIYGLGAYNKSDGTHTLFRVANRDLEKFDGTDTWSATDTDEWPASKKVNMINFLDRMYYGSEDGATALAYSDENGTLTDVTPTIGGHILGVNKSILAVGGNSLRPNVIFYSDAYTDNFYYSTGTCAADADTNGANTVETTASVFEATDIGAILYNTTDGAMNFITEWTNATVPYVTTDAATSGWNNDTVYVLRNNFTQDGEVIGIIGYQDMFVSFDEENMYLWDPTSTWSKKLPGFGCVNERTIAIVEGMLFWANREGVYMYDGTGSPVEVSKKIKDDVDGYGIWNLINDSNWGQLAAGGFDGKYYLSLGDLSTQSGAPASAVTNAELVLDVKSASWMLNSRDDEPMVYASFINSSGAKDLYYGEKTNLAVYKMNSGTTDATSAGGTANISAEVRTPYFIFKDPTIQWRIDKYYVRYKSGGDVTMTHSVDHGSYSAVDTLSSASSSTIESIIPPTESQGYTFSLKFATTSTFSLEAVGFVAYPVSFGKART